MTIELEKNLCTNYIERTLIGEDVINLSNFTKSNITTDSLFIITNTFNKEELKSIYVKLESVAESIDSIKEDTKFVIASQDDFLELSKTRKNVHEVHYDAFFNYLTWIRSSRGADLHSLRKTVLDEYFLKDIEVKYDRAATIIFADYGMGKTTYLKHIANDVTKEDAIYLDDKDFRKFFDEFEVWNLDNFLKFVDADLNHPNLHLMIDNVEHLSEFDAILEILTNLHMNCSNIKLWVACSERTTRGKLEAKLGTFSCSLKPLLEEQQEQYLRQIWDFKNINCESYIKSLIDLCNAEKWTSFIGNNHSNIQYHFCSYPLNLKIIGSNFKPDSNGLPSKVSILELYENFVNMNYKDIIVSEFSENINISEFRNVNDYISARWFSQNYKNYRKEIEQIFRSEPYNRIFLYFFNRLLCRNKPLHTAIINQNFEYNILVPNLNINEQDDGGRTALHLAENINFIDLLVQNGAQTEIQDDVLKWTPLEYMDYNSHLDGIDILLKHNASSESLHKTLSLSETELAERFETAITDRLETYVKFICQNCKNLVVTPKNINSAMYMKDVIMLILKRAEKTGEFYVDFLGRTALFYAVEVDYVEALKYLITDLKYDIFYRGFDGKTLLHVACESGHIETVKYLLELGLGINDVDKNNCNAFHHCCATNNLEILKYLIQEGIDTTGKSAGLESPLEIACTSGSTDVVKYLLENAGNLNLTHNVNSLKCLHDAVYCSSIELTRLILSEMKININEKLNGVTVLHIACVKDNKDIIKMLINAGADVNGTDDNGATPLFEIYYTNDLETLKMLCSSGCNVSHVNKKGETALHSFLENRPFMFSHGDREIELHRGIIESLKRNGLDINAKSSNGTTPLHVACNGNIQVIKLLIQNGADVNISNDKGESPLHLCYFGRDNVEICSYFVSLGVDVNIKTKLGKTPLMYTAGFPEMTKKLIELGADIFVKDNEERNLVHFFAKYGHMNTLDILLEAGFKDAKSVDCLGQTPLHYAAKEDQYDCLRYLIKNFDYDLSIVDNNGKTAGDLAQNSRIKKLLEIL